VHNSSSLLGGGLVYVGKESFMLHKRDLPQHREAFEFSPLNNVTLSLVELRLKFASSLVD